MGTVGTYNPLEKLLGPPKTAGSGSAGAYNSVGFTPQAWVIGDSISANGAAWRYNLYSAYSGLINMVGTLYSSASPDAIPGQGWHDAIGGLAIPGMISGVLPRLGTLVFPDIVFCMQGINDIAGGADAPTVLSRLSSAYDLLWSQGSPGKPWFQIVSLGMLKSLFSTAENDAVIAVNAGLPAMIAGKSYASSVTFIPGTYASINPATISNGNYADERHPWTPGGYTQLAAPIIVGAAPAILKARP